MINVNVDQVSACHLRSFLLLIFAMWIGPRLALKHSRHQTVSSTFRLTVNFNFKDMESPKQFMERLKFRECYNCSITGREIKGEDRRRLRDEFCQR